MIKIITEIVFVLGTAIFGVIARKVSIDNIKDLNNERKRHEAAEIDSAKDASVTLSKEAKSI